jgi:hypothetical protein
MIGIDVETTALRPAEGDLRLVQLSDGKRAKVYDAFRQDAEAIRRAIEQHDELVAHNAVFEREWLNAALDVDRPDLHDTMIMSQVYYTGTRAALSKSFSHRQPRRGRQTRAKARAGEGRTGLGLGRSGAHTRADRVRCPGRRDTAAARGHARAQDRAGGPYEGLRAGAARLPRRARHGAAGRCLSTRTGSKR